MTHVEIMLIILALTAVLGVVNELGINEGLFKGKFQLPDSIGLLTLTLLGVLILVLVADPITVEKISGELRPLILDEKLLLGIIAATLFAGSLTLHLEEIQKRAGALLLLSTLSMVISTLIIGSAAYVVLSWSDRWASFVECLIFGAAISITDPVAIVSILKDCKLPKEKHHFIAAESLFNDGVGVAVVAILAQVTKHVREPEMGAIVGKFAAQHLLGGLALGWALAWITYHLLRGMDDHKTEILLTLGVVFGGYLLCTWLDLSEPIAMITAGIIIGNHGKDEAMSKKTEKELDSFWEFVDSMLESTLFVLMGLSALLLRWDLDLLKWSIVVVLATVAARWASLHIPLPLTRDPIVEKPGVLKLLFWAGVRGAISFAMVLKIPDEAHRERFLLMTFVIIVLSVIGKGLMFHHEAKKQVEPATA